MRRSPSVEAAAASGPGGRDPGWTALSAPGELRALPSQPRVRLAREGRTGDVHHPVPRRPLSDKARVNVGDSFKSTPSRRGVVYVLKYRIFLIQGKASGCHLKTHFYSCLSVYLARAMCRWPAGRGGPGGLRVPAAASSPRVQEPRRGCSRPRGLGRRHVHVCHLQTRCALCSSKPNLKNCC